MGRSPLLRPLKFLESFLVTPNVCGISSTFALLSPVEGQVSYVLRTRSPLSTLLRSVRLACIRHAASVHPEPGSNSPSIVAPRLCLQRRAANARSHRAPVGFVLLSELTFVPK